MRIFQAIETSTNLAIADNQTWYRNLHEPLVEMGHDVVFFDAAEGRRAIFRQSQNLRDRFSQKLLDCVVKEHKKKPIDLFFSYFIDGMVDPSVVSRIRELGIPTCNFSCNNVHQFDLVDELSPYFDFNLYAEKNVQSKFEAIGAKGVWFPMASNPKYFKPVLVKRSRDATFVGANYGIRARIVYHLLVSGIDVHMFGPGWQWGAKNEFRSYAKRAYYLTKALIACHPISQSISSALLAEHDFRRKLMCQYPQNVHKPLSDEALIRMYSESHISLGILDVYAEHDPTNVLVRHLHLREFEAPLCGALYCTGYSDELAVHFEPEKEVVTYRNVYELVEKLRYYLANPEAGEKVRRAGRARALAEHTYHQRFKQLFHKIGLKN